MSKFIFLIKSYFVPKVSRFSAFLTFTTLFFLSLFILTFLASYFHLFVFELVSSSEEVFDYIYPSVEDNSDSAGAHSGSHPPFSGERGQLPCIEDNDSWKGHDPIHPCSREDEDYLDYIFPDSSKHKPYIDRPPFPGEETRFPCVEDKNGWEKHNPVDFFANKDNFRDFSDPTTTSSPVTTASKQGFFVSLFTKVSSFFHSLISKPKSNDNSKESITQFQDFVARHNRAVYNRAIRTAHLTPLCTKRNKKDHDKISFEDLVKLNIKPPANHYSWTTISPADKALFNKNLFSDIFSKISSTKQP